MQSAASTNAGFVTGTTALTPFAAYVTLPSANSINSQVYQVNSNTTVFQSGASTSAAYALQINNGSTLSNIAPITFTIGNNATEAGLILNSGSSIQANADVSNPFTLAFGAAEGLIYVNGNSFISANITGSAGITVFGPLSTNNGQITGTTGSLTYSGTDGFTGAITVNNATLVLANSVGTIANAINVRGGTLNIAPYTPANWALTGIQLAPAAGPST